MINMKNFLILLAVIAFNTNPAIAVSLKPQAEIYLKNIAFTPEALTEHLTLAVKCGIDEKECIKADPLHSQEPSVKRYNSFKEIFRGLRGKWATHYNGDETTLVARADAVITKNEWFDATPSTDIDERLDSVFYGVSRYLLKTISTTNLSACFEYAKKQVGQRLISAYVSIPDTRLHLLQASTIAEKIAHGFESGTHYNPTWRKTFFCNLSQDPFNGRYNNEIACGTEFDLSNILEDKFDLWFYGFLYRRMYRDDPSLTDVQRKTIALEWRNILLELSNTPNPLIIAQ